MEEIKLKFKEKLFNHLTSDHIFPSIITDTTHCHGSAIFADKIDTPSRINSNSNFFNSSTHMDLNRDKERISAIKEVVEVL